MSGGARASAFASDTDRFSKKAFIKSVGKSVPLKWEGEKIGTVTLLSVIVHEDRAQATFDFQLDDDASVMFRKGMATG